MKAVPKKEKKLLKHALLFYDYAEVKQHVFKVFGAEDWLALDDWLGNL